MSRFPVRFVLACLSVFLLLPSAARGQVTVQQILDIRPAQKDVEIETPAAEEVAKCRIEPEGKSGWLLYSPQGQVLRRFIDGDNDGRVDTFSYYMHGLEVYRDYDTNKNDKVDQSRWMNTLGSRWGIDSNEDGRIDRWKRISAEEASREAVKALAAGDEDLLRTVLITPEDLQQLKIKDELANKIIERTRRPGPQMAQIRAQSKVITPQTNWLRFDSSMLMPNLIPAESGKAAQDLVVYENVMAIVDVSGTNGFVQVGEMVQVGDTWKLTQVPEPVEGDRVEAEAGLLLQQMVNPDSLTSTNVSEEVQKLIEQLQALDAKAPSPESGAAEVNRYNVSRARLLGQIAAAVTSKEDRTLWLRQQIEFIAVAVQMDSYPNGEQELVQLEDSLKKNPADADLLSFVVFQRMLLGYNSALQKANAQNRQQVQEDWLKSLEAFATQYPNSSNAPDALLQLAITHEFNGNGTEAQKWYQSIIGKYASSDAAARARGALRRLTLKGQRIQLAGNSLSGGTLDLRAYQNKVVAVIFWATWCTPCTQDLPQVQELYRTYQRQGFEIVGVNLDAPGAPVAQYIQQNKVPWPHIYEEGALESRPAIEFGIISLPTIFLIDKRGVVVSPNSSVDELKKMVPELLKAN
ncbi:MAG: redoxin domain-containing protein [Planctomycetaceae bacterium]|nr:redoxin domain-containing protein [Planctomycetaceae bacterium]MCB9953160.1 redoxin domain-containing protein [Planctomycetaceae bacterium]